MLDTFPNFTKKQKDMLSKIREHIESKNSCLFCKKPDCRGECLINEILKDYYVRKRVEQNNQNK